MECLRLMVALSLALAVAGHRYTPRFGHSPFLTHNRGMFWRRLPGLMPRYPTSLAGFRHQRMPFLNRYPGTTVYPAKGRGPLYRPMWPAELNTYHPQGTLRPDVVIPAEDVLINNGVSGQQIQPDFNRAPVFIVPGAGFLRPATPEGKPDIIPDSQDANVSPPEVKPIDLTPDNVDDSSRPTEPLPPVITITSMVDDSEKNDSCHVKGCGTGHECVFNQKYICPIYIPSVPCECVPGCRMDYTFIPLGGFIKIDDCGNTCSCNNIYGAILRNALEDFERNETTNLIEVQLPDNDLDMNNSSCDNTRTSCKSDAGTQVESSYDTKKVQVNLHPPQRTRAHQTNIPKSSVNVGTQTDSYRESFTKCKCKCYCKENAKAFNSASGDNEEMELDTSWEEMDDSDDEDYEPDDDACSDCDEDDDGNDVDGEGEVSVPNYQLKRDPQPDEERHFIVSESALAELLSVCKVCGSLSTPVINFTRGTLIVTESVCANGHSLLWKSQPCHNALPWSNMFTVMSILTSGCNASKVLQMFRNLNVQMFSGRTLSRIQSLYVIPSVCITWNHEQNQILNEIGGSAVTVGGDARCDSPGYSAKYGSYTLMDLERNKILDVELVQSNEVKGSCHMELEGLKRCIAFLEKYVTIKSLVTDRHCMVKKYMREQHQDKNHFFDVWHVSKGVSKKLEAAAKRQRGAQIRPWIKSIVNHCYYIAASSGEDGDEKYNKWLSISDHVSNHHENCSHAELAENREWLTKGSVPYKLMKEVIENRALLRDVPKLSPTHQTYGLEVYHSVVNHYAPKSTHFYFPAMLARIYTAALHYNENSSRRQAKTKTGALRYSLVYPKAKKGTEAVVKPIKSAPTFDYVNLIKQAMVERRLRICPTYASAEEEILSQKALNPPPLTSNFVDANKDYLIEQHRSRFSKL